MRTWTTLKIVFLVVVGLASPAWTAEVGDFDGDGLLTIGDVILMKESRRNPDGGVLAPGSLDAFVEYPCYVPPAESANSHGDWVPASVYFESLRRSFDGSLPVYSTMHWPTPWIDAAMQLPLPVDDRVRIELFSVVAGTVDRIEVTWNLSTDVPVRAFSIALESEDGLVRVPWKWPSQFQNLRANWHWTKWNRLSQVNSSRHEAGDLVTQVPPAAYLITGGRYVVNYGVLFDQTLVPGSHLVVTEGRLPVGTREGVYGLYVSRASQVLLEDGSVVAPKVLGAGSINVEREIREGWDEGVPPLEFDVGNRRVMGATVFRFVDIHGNPPEEDSPITVARPGEEVAFRVQVRTEVPLNFLHFEFDWPAGALGCTGRSRSLLQDQGEDFVVGRPLHEVCSDLQVGRFSSWYWVGGNWSSSGGRQATTHPERALEYIRPLGEWIDLYEARVLVNPGFKGNAIPLVFEKYMPGGRIPDVEFAPYARGYPCLSDEFPDERDHWEYDVQHESSFIRVEGGDPIEPPDLGIRFVIGDVRVHRGDVVEVPVYASADAPLLDLRLAVELDPEVLSVVSVDTHVMNLDTGEHVLDSVGRGEVSAFKHCPPNDPCVFGVPLFTHFRASDDEFVVVDWVSGVEDISYPGAEQSEVARLLVQISPDTSAMEARLRPVVVSLKVDGLDVLFESGGDQFPHDPTIPFSPASSFVGGRVEIIQRSAFVRGDVNLDLDVNLSDAVAILDHLFASGPEPRCLDSADANDDGRVNVSDPVFLLESLFGGGAALPPPNSDCGADPSVDELTCPATRCE